MSSEQFMRIVFVTIFILLLLFLQIGMFPHLRIGGIFPNLIVLAVLSLSIIRGWKKSLPWIVVSGLFLDFYSLSNFLGISIASLLLASYLSYFLNQNFFKGTNFFSLFFVFLITIFVYNFCLIALFKIFGISFDFNIASFIVGIIYNLVLALPIFYLIKKICPKT